MPAAFPWRPWLVASLIAGSGAALLAWAEPGFAKKLDAAGWITVVVTTAPVLAMQVLLGLPGFAARMRAWVDGDPRAVGRFGVGMGALAVVCGLGVGRFDPYVAAILVFGILAALGALREVPRGSPGLTWTEGVVWLLIWIPFDLRWNRGLWLGPPGFDYTWWAMALTVVAVFGWGIVRDLPGFGYRLIPNRRDLIITGVAVVAFSAALIPIGLAIGFLKFPPTTPLTLAGVVGTFVGLFLTVAIPEELFFRAILQRGLEARFRRPWPALVLASAAFGLMHWNNVGDLGTQIAYCTLATIAGGIYGWAYRRSDGLIAPVLVHTIADLVWKFAFQ